MDVQAVGHRDAAAVRVEPRGQRVEQVVATEDGAQLLLDELAEPLAGHRQQKARPTERREPQLQVPRPTPQHRQRGLRLEEGPGRLVPVLDPRATRQICRPPVELQSPLRSSYAVLCPTKKKPSL